MAEQYQVITLELLFMSQLMSVRGAFPKKMGMIGGIVIGEAQKRPRPMMLQLPGIMLPEQKILKIYAIIVPLVQE